MVNKTIEQWLQEIPDPLIKERALKNMFWEYAQDNAPTLSSALRTAFNFVRSPEGPKYWMEIWQKFI